MIFHIMKDGTRRDSIDGYIVRYEQNKELYRRIWRKNNGNKNTSGNFRKKQVLDR